MKKTIAFIATILATLAMVFGPGMVSPASATDGQSVCSTNGLPKVCGYTSYQGSGSTFRINSYTVCLGQPGARKLKNGRFYVYGSAGALKYSGAMPDPASGSCGVDLIYLSSGAGARWVMIGTIDIAFGNDRAYAICGYVTGGGYGTQPGQC